MSKKNQTAVVTNVDTENKFVTVSLEDSILASGTEEVQIPMEAIVPSVGATQQAKEGKAKLRLVVLPDALQQLMDAGIPVRKAVFHKTIIFDYTNSTAEYAYYAATWAKDQKKNRIANMWYTPHGLVMEKDGIIKIIPLANVADTTV